jgi:hypothetical protein
MTATELTVRQARAQIVTSIVAEYRNAGLPLAELTALPTIERWRGDILRQAVDDAIRAGQIHQRYGRLVIGGPA